MLYVFLFTTSQAFLTFPPFLTNLVPRFFSASSCDDRQVIIMTDHTRHPTIGNGEVVSLTHTGTYHKNPHVQNVFEKSHLVQTGGKVYGDAG